MQRALSPLAKPQVRPREELKEPLLKKPDVPVSIPGLEEEESGLGAAFLWVL